MKKKILGIVTAFVMVLSVVSFIPLKAETKGTGGSTGPVAKIGTVEYATLEEAVAAAEKTAFTTKAAPETATTITLLKDTNAGIDVGKSGQLLQNIILDLNQKTLTLGPAVGSTGTETNGLRVLSYSKILIKNGVITSSDIQNEAGCVVRYMLVNYGTMTLDNVTVNPGSTVMGTINNCGDLSLKGSTTISTAPLSDGFSAPFAITNDVYWAHYTDFDGSLTVASENVTVGTVRLERYADDRGGNKGKIVLNISNGKYGEFITYGGENVGIEANITGGSFSKDVSAYVATGYSCAKVGDVYKVAPVATGVTLDKTAIRVEKGNTDTLTASITPATSLDTVTWSTSNDKVATVVNGKVTAVGVGTAKITATVNGEKAECTVTVFEVKPPVIETTPSTGDKTTVTVEKEAVEVLEESVKEVIKNVETTPAISADTKEKLKEAIKEGKIISVEPAVAALTEETVKKEVVAKIEKVLGTKEEVAQYFDLSMNLTADGKPIGTINELTETVTFTVTIDKDLIKAGRTFYMIRVHDGKAEKINGTLKGGEFTFETDKFSTYALVYDDTKVETPTTPTETPTTTPTDTNKGVDTGDTTSTNALFALMGLAIVGMGSVAYRKRVSK